MGSFQQIIMGIGCLIAAFWFGSILQDRPAGQNQTVKLLPDGTIDPYAAVASPNLMEKTKGFLSSMFESPAKEKPITVADLRQNSKAKMPNLPGLEDHHKNHSHDRVAGQPRELDLLKNLANGNLANDNLLKLNGESNGESNGDLAPQRLIGSFQSKAPDANSAKVAIVPDFSSLAEEVNRGLSFNNGAADTMPGPQENLVANRPTNSDSSIELIPVPKFSDVGVRKAEAIADPNWESVRKQVAAAESRLESYRNQMTQPIPEIVDSVNQRTREFWDRQQAEARRRPAQPAPLVTNEQSNISQQRRLKPETFSQQQQRWDVFSPNLDRRKFETKPRNQSTEAPNVGHRALAPTPQPRSLPARTPSIVEVNRRFVSQPQQPNRNSSARVRSLNDDRTDASPYVVPDNAAPPSDRFTYNDRQNPQPTEMQNQLRPQYNPNAGSKPEFVSPPDYGQFSPQANAATSEIVVAARVAYGSFREYETQPRDTLQTISEKFYGSADYYFDLYLANRDLLSNPATVPAGLTIKVPKFDGR